LRDYCPSIKQSIFILEFIENKTPTALSMEQKTPVKQNTFAGRDTPRTVQKTPFETPGKPQHFWSPGNDPITPPKKPKFDDPEKTGIPYLGGANGYESDSDEDTGVSLNGAGVFDADSDTDSEGHEGDNKSGTSIIVGQAGLLDDSDSDTENTGPVVVIGYEEMEGPELDSDSDSDDEPVTLLGGPGPMEARSYRPLRKRTKSLRKTRKSKAQEPSVRRQKLACLTFLVVFVVLSILSFQLDWPVWSQAVSLTATTVTALLSLYILKRSIAKHQKLQDRSIARPTEHKSFGFE